MPRTSYKTIMVFRIMHRIAFLLLLLALITGGCALPAKVKHRAELSPAMATKTDDKPSAHAIPPRENTMAIKPDAVRDNTAINREEFKPLLEAMEKMDRFAHACHAYTGDEIYEYQGGKKFRTIHRYDASKRPAERVDLILVNNEPPSEEQKRISAKAGRNFYGGKKEYGAWMEEAIRCIKYDACHIESNDGILKYIFITRHRGSCGLMSFFINGVYGYRSGCTVEYEIDISTCTFISYRKIFPNGLAVRDMFGDRLKLHEIRRAYVHAPGHDIPLSSTYQLRLRTSGPVAGNGEKADRATTITISDYKKVTCYDDRLNVNIGEATIIDKDKPNR